MKIVLPLATLTESKAPYMRVYMIHPIVGFSKLGFRLETTEAHRFFSHYGFLTLENQRCLVEMIEFALGKNRYSHIILFANHEESAENAFLVTRKLVGHIPVFSFDVPITTGIK